MRHRYPGRLTCRACPISPHPPTLFSATRLILTLPRAPRSATSMPCHGLNVSFVHLQRLPQRTFAYPLCLLGKHGRSGGVGDEDGAGKQRQQALCPAVRDASEVCSPKRRHRSRPSGTQVQLCYFFIFLHLSLISCLCVSLIVHSACPPPNITCAPPRLCPNARQNRLQLSAGAFHSVFARCCLGLLGRLSSLSFHKNEAVFLRFEH